MKPIEISPIMEIEFRLAKHLRKVLNMDISEPVLPCKPLSTLPSKPVE